METVLQVLKKTEAFFAKAGIESAKVDAEWILAYGLGCKRLELFLQFEKPLTEDELNRLRPLVKRRAQREPLQIILGTVDFVGLELKVQSGVLIPRPETEEFVERILERMPEDDAKVIDLGTGTGAIAMAIAAARAKAIVLAIDSDPTALSLAKENVKSHDLSERVKVRSGNWLEGLDVKVDWIVSNPPYLRETEWASAEPEVKDYDPKTALVASDEGLGDAKIILEQATHCLNSGGHVAMELGVNHPHELKSLAGKLGYTDVECLEDLNRRQRFFFATWAGK